MEYNIKEIIDIMTDTATICGKIFMSAQDEHIVTSNKTGARDLVTAYDLKVQQTAISRLSEKFPSAEFYGEEGDSQGLLNAKITFVIDPIDGTANFANNMNISCISIACFLSGVPSAGVVYNPYTNELYSGGVGIGAFLNSRPIHVTEKPLSNSLVLFGTSPYNLELFGRTMEKLEYIFPKCLDVRRCGAAALDICAVAAGKAGLFFEEILALWDFAAAFVILQEAGGIAVTMKGEPLPLNGARTNIIAGSLKAIDESELLKKFNR